MFTCVSPKMSPQAKGHKILLLFTSLTIFTSLASITRSSILIHFLYCHSSSIIYFHPSSSIFMDGDDDDDGNDDDDDDEI